MFKANAGVHDYSTRQAKYFIYHYLKKKMIGKSNISYRGAVIWNKIMSFKIRTHFNKAIFCGDMKNLLIKNTSQFID